MNESKRNGQKFHCCQVLPFELANSLRGRCIPSWVFFGRGVLRAAESQYETASGET